MSKTNKTINVNPDPQYPNHETYDVTFADYQKASDQARWIGTLSTHEFPHNAGALEEEIDEKQHVRYTELEDGMFNFGTYGKGKGY